MKQETIDLIKSMTEQGFLVIVDPGKLKGDGAVMIEVINLKDGAIDEKINDEIAKLAGFKKEDKKPEIDLLKCDGRRFRAKIHSHECEGVIKVLDDIEHGVYLCQDYIDAASYNIDKCGYQYAYFMHIDGRKQGVTDFELLPEPIVIFINCVGEVFTEEDVKNNINIMWWSFFDRKIMIGNLQGIVHNGVIGYTTDIFRSKKSLLKYLYETCE